MDRLRLFCIVSYTALLALSACAEQTSAATPGAGNDDDGSLEDEGTASDDSTSSDVGTASDAGSPAKPRIDASHTPPQKADARVNDTLGGDGGRADQGPQDAGSALPRDTLAPKCMKKDSQLIVIGDSFINWPLSHTFPQDLIDASKQTWRMKAEGAMSMATGGLQSVYGMYIPMQFDNAMAEDADAHTVLMDGGGNDVLLSFDPEIEAACKELGAAKHPACQRVLDRAFEAITALFDRMAKAGIRDVVYFFYPHIPEGRPVGGAHPNEMLDFALPQFRAVCDQAEAQTDGKTRCTFIDMVPVFEGKPVADWFNADIHPTPVGSKAMAQKVWSVMSERCIGQKAGAHCCED